ncbi:eukaryotic translation initiation factor 4E [Dimargaris cristalligena]|uniref:Translation initiation factor eIF 4e-like domain-containing protein n=1 Tax=Dimargaris cristalligena TaxID=215637 RepID=A0A4P9ZV61_9FUNG|nr:eukaryotic translation initiation factor 4E [Dimargaris cristalligena]RKP37453.1 translation initiation factor eIF 4e-like domain-containing protein [Dimargaris cristalligena]|eukprot:RKP37453.1 translation initiation factor eIF 4e-like domain-containing protein [Dimargaris cristalligena]
MSVQSTSPTTQDQQPMKTIFNDPHDFDVKHPLQNAWTLWYDNPTKRTNTNTWSQNLREIITFSTVEDFWGAHNNINRATDIPAGANYHLFKEGIKPMWEDVANEHGGRWVVQLPRKPAEANTLWLYALLALIGETFENEDDICGVVFACRRSQFRISLWTRIADNQEICENIGRQLRASLNIPTQIKMEFSEHNSGDNGPKYHYFV